MRQNSFYECIFNLKRKLVAVTILLLWMAPASAQGCYETPWFSEEQTQGMFCNTGYAVRAIKCSGSYCDNKSLTCCPYTQGYDRSARFQWSDWFSEEGGEVGRQRLNPGAFISGLSCSGSYCDWIAINFLYSPLLRNTGQCRYSAQFSEEAPGTASCFGNEFAAGLRCEGDYCDRLELYCCAYSN